MKIAIDCHVHDIIHVLSQTGSKLITLTSKDIELFHASLQLSKIGDNYRKAVAEAKKVLESDYGVQTNIPDNLFSNISWCIIEHEILAHEFRVNISMCKGSWKYTQDGLAKRSISIEFTMENTGLPGTENEFIIVIECTEFADCINDNYESIDDDVMHHYIETNSISFCNRPEISLSDIDDEININYWIFWKGVPKYVRALTITALHKFITDNIDIVAPSSDIRLFDTETGRIS